MTFYTSQLVFLWSLLSLIQDDKEAAEELICLAMSELQHPQSPVTQSKGTRRQTAQSSTAEPALSSTTNKHPIIGARANLMLAKLKNASFSNASAGSVKLAGCSDSLAQRRLSHTLASTSHGAGTQQAGAKGRAVTGTGRSTRRTRGKAALTVDDEADSRSQLGVGEDTDKERLRVLEQAELLLQGYHASHGHPLLHR